MKSRGLACFFLALAAASAAQEITIGEYLRRVRDNHPFFREEELKVPIEEREAESFLGGQEWVFTVSPSYTHFGETSASELVAGAGWADQAAVGVGAQRLFWSSGATLGVGVSSGYRRYESSPDPVESYIQGVNLLYIQPLLKNRGGMLHRQGFEVARYNAARVRLEIEETREAFLLEKAQLFVDWALAGEEIRIARLRVDLAREQLRQVERRFSSNLVDRADVLRAEDAARSADQAVIQLQSQWSARQAELAVVAADEAVYRSSPSLDLYVSGALPDVEADSAALATNARVLRPLEVVLRQLAQQKVGLQEELRPDLTLTLGAGLRGADEKIVESLKLLHPDVTVTLEYRMPSGHAAVEARIAKIEAQERQIREEMRSIVTELQAALRGLYIRIRDTGKILELGGQQVESAQQRTAEEIRLYNQGRGQLTFVIQSRDSEQNARLAQAANAARLQRLRLQYQALMDELSPSKGNTP